MAFGIPSDIVVLVLIEEATGAEPTEETRDVPQAFRRLLREEIADIRARGGIVDIPSEMPDPEEVT